MEKRIQLKKGKQKQLVEKAKSKLNCSWKKLAKELSVSAGYLKNELRNEKRLLAEPVYKKLCKLNNGEITMQIEHPVPYFLIQRIFYTKLSHTCIC